MRRRSSLSGRCGSRRCSAAAAPRPDAVQARVGRPQARLAGPRPPLADKPVRGPPEWPRLGDMENGAMGTRPPGINIVNAAVGACFIALGVLLLLEGNGVVQMEQIVRLWPIGLVVLGAAAVWQASRGGDAMPRSGSGAGWL